MLGLFALLCFFPHNEINVALYFQSLLCLCSCELSCNEYEHVGVAAAETQLAKR